MDGSDQAANASVEALIAEKRKYIVPMIAVYVISFIGLNLLAGFAKDVIGTHVFGPVNLGYALIAFNYLLSWVLALVYVRIAREKFDPLIAKAASDIKALEATR